MRKRGFRSRRSSMRDEKEKPAEQEKREWEREREREREGEIDCGGRKH